jgi:NAD+ diphosphatase
MLKTPTTFVPLLDAHASAHADHSPINYIFHAGRLLLRDDGSLPEGSEGLRDVDPARLHPVGLLNGRYCRTGWADGDHAAPPGYRFESLRALLGEMDGELVGVAARAAQIAEWARTHQFCGACGTRTGVLTGERCYKCPACGFAAYPRISPAMMVLIRKGDQVLLAQHVSYATKRHVPLAGFLEAGESIEEAVHREVFEEVGLRVHNLAYFGSQAWPFPHSLMIAFTADYLDGEIRVDPNEIAEARWFGPEDFPEPGTNISISTALIEAHRPGRWQR